MLQALAMGAQPNWHNSDEEGQTALIQSIKSVSAPMQYNTFLALQEHTVSWAKFDILAAKMFSIGSHINCLFSQRKHSYTRVFAMLSGFDDGIDCVVRVR